MHVAFYLINLQECEKNGEKSQKEQCRSDGFRRWKAESQEYQVRTVESRIAEVTGSDDGKLDRGVSDLDDGKPKSTESTEGALNPIFKPGGKSSYLRVSCYFDINYVKHNLHQSGGKLLTLDFCP